MQKKSCEVFDLWYGNGCRMHVIMNGEPLKEVIGFFYVPGVASGT